MKFTVSGTKDEFITLKNPAGDTADFELIDAVIYGGEEYAVLLERGDDAVTILRLDESDGKEAYETVDDDGVFDKVYEMFLAEEDD